jgi:hypothetical protein
MNAKISLRNSPVFPIGTMLARRSVAIKMTSNYEALAVPARFVNMWNIRMTCKRNVIFTAMNVAADRVIFLCLDEAQKHHESDQSPTWNIGKRGRDHRRKTGA